MKRIGFVTLFLIVFSSQIFAEGTWNHITHAAGHEIGYVTDIATGIDTTLWVASENGIFWYKDSLWNFEDVNAYYKLICTAPNGDVWLVSQKSIYKYNNGETLEIFNTSGHIYGISIDENGIVWCSILKNGVYRYKDSSWKVFTTEDGLADNYVSRLVVSPSCEVWIRYSEPFEWDVAQTDYGVSRFNNDTWELFNTENGLVSNAVEDIAFGPDGSVYVSQDPKSHNPIISKYDGTSWEVIASISGYLGFDLEGYLWVSHPIQREVYKFDLTSGTIIEQYYTGDFLHPPVFVDDGSIWIGLNDGLLLLDTETGITDESNSQPEEFIQLSNYPNPFNPSTAIDFSIETEGFVTLDIYNIAGQRITTLVSQKLTAGYYSTLWDGRDADGSDVSSGVYFSRLTSAGMQKTGKMLLVK